MSNLAEHLPTERFSNRVENYVKYRPGYPPPLIPFLQQELGLTPQTVVADIGCGTGLSSQPFAAFGCQVYGIEPNEAMRQAAQQFLTAYPNFVALPGRAEATTLPDQSADLVMAAQALHWFDLEPTRAEFRRIVRPGGWLFILYNDWHGQQTPFAYGYNRLLEQYGLEYGSVRHDRSLVEVLEILFAPAGYRHHTFPYYQDFDFEGLRGRLLSSSYTPLPDHPNHAPLMAGLADLFAQFQVGGKVRFAYTTNLYYGR